jgi:hypothetical protein
MISGDYDFAGMRPLAGASSLSTAGGRASETPANA